MTARLKALARVATLAMVVLIIAVTIAAQPEQSVGWVKDRLADIGDGTAAVLQWARRIGDAIFS